MFVFSPLEYNLQSYVRWEWSLDTVLRKGWSFFSFDAKVSLMIRLFYYLEDLRLRVYHDASIILSLIRRLGDFCSIKTVLKTKFLEVIYFNFAICLFAIIIIQIFYTRYLLFLLLSFLSVGNKWHYVIYDSTKGWQQLAITDCRLTLVFSFR